MAFLTVSGGEPRPDGRDPVMAQLRERLESLEAHCLTNLENGLTAMTEGDLTVAVAPRTTPIEATSDDPDVAALVEVFNRMLGKAQTALEGYNTVREELREALGDRSCLSDLRTRLGSLEANCLTNLESGLTAMTEGDLTVEVNPKTTPIESEAGSEPGQLAEIFNSMLGRAQTSLESYNAMREELRGALGDQSCLTDLRTRLTSLSDNCLTNLQKGLQAMADGDLTIEVKPVTTPLGSADGSDPGELANIFNGMLGRAQTSLEAYEDMRGGITDMIRQILDSSGVVANASTQMASTSEETTRAVSQIADAVSEVAQGAERQVRSVESVKGLTEQMVAATATSAENASETSSAAQETRKVVSEGTEAVRKATEAMEGVRASSSDATNAIRELGTKSEQIGGIVDTITGIAEQTNLLALNAAIEAARAGEQGRGFAVVAEEVRKLAEESRQAASSIAGLVKEIQQHTSNAVTVVEEGGTRTEEGARTVDYARSAFEQIGTAVDDMNQRVHEITQAIEQIAQSSQQVQEDIGEVAAVAEQSSATTQEVSASTEETSASTQEIASSAQELKATSLGLQTLVDRFTIATNGSGSYTESYN